MLTNGTTYDAMTAISKILKPNLFKSTGTCLSTVLFAIQKSSSNALDLRMIRFIPLLIDKTTETL